MYSKWLDEKRFIKIIEDPWFNLLAKLQDAVTTITYEYWKDKGLITFHLPITTTSISSPMGLGSDSKPVSIDLYGVKTYLADSMQFMLEYGCRFSKDGCYYVMPSFRGELADETHLCQFFHSEVEIPCNLDNAISIAESYVKYLSQKILEKYKEQIANIVGDVQHIENFCNRKDKVPQISFKEALNLLCNNPSYIINHGKWHTINRAGEQKLMEYFDGVVWIKKFDHLAVPFYQSFSDESKMTAQNADLLLGIGEVIGLGERHEFGYEVVDALSLHNVNHKDYQWYIDLKNQYPIKTSGFGMGIERFFMWLLKHKDIRDLQILPRFNGERHNI